MKIRRFLSLVLCLCMVMALFVGIPATANAEDVITYKVENGDYLFKICKNLGLDYYQCKNAIMILNGYTSELQLSRISVGQTIKLPASNAVAATVKASTTTTVATTTTAGSTTTVTTTSSTISGVPGAASAYNYAFYLVQHTVQYGQTLTTICNQYGTSYAAYSSMILAMNGLKSANSVWAGKTIYVPSATVPAAGAAYGVVAHTVANGQTMTSICAQYGISLANWSAVIQGLNTGINMNSVKVGQKVYIPTPISTVPSSGISTVPSTGAPSSPTAVNTGYEITFRDINTAEGTPYATVNGVNVSKAAAGSTIVVAGNSSTGYAIHTIDVYTGDGASKSTFLGNSFTMPSCNVRIKVNYKEAYGVVKNPTTNGTFEILVSGVPDHYALPGDKITVVPEPNTGFSVKKISVDGVALPASAKQKDGTWTFTMPTPAGKDVNVDVEFKDAEYKELSWNEVSGLTNGSFIVKVNNMQIPNKSGVAKDASVVVYLNPNPGIGADVTVTEKGTTNQIAVVAVSGNTYSFKMPEKDSQINIRYYNSTRYNINTRLVQENSGTVAYSVFGNNTFSALPGEEVTIIPVAANYYEFKEAYVRFANNNAAVAMTSPTSFIMPATDVNVFVEFGKVNEATKHAVTFVSGNYTGAITDDTGLQRQMFVQSEWVRVHFDFDHNKWKNIKVQYRLVGTEPWTDATALGNEWYRFQMLNGNVEVRALLEPFSNWVTIHLKNAVNSDGGVVVLLTASVDNVIAADGTIVENASKVVLTATVAEGYSFEGFTVSSGAKNELVKIDDTHSSYIIHWDDPASLTFEAKAS